MKVIVPAAGVGTRLRPLTHTRPKALLHVAGRPIISHILDEVGRLDVTGVVVIVGYKGDLVREYVASEYPALKVDFVVQEKRQGIGHAVYLARELADAGEPLLIILGDTIVRTDLKAIVRSESNVLGVKEVRDPRRFGVAEVKNGAIVRLVEKPQRPKSRLAMVGLYYVTDSRALFQTLDRQINDRVKSHGEYQITDALQMMIDGGARFSPFEIDEWFDCGKPETLLETNRRLLEGRTDAPRIEGSVIVPPVAIDPRAAISSSIVGPFVSVASGCTITNSIVRDSVLDKGASVTECVLERCIIGSEAVVKGAAKTLNIGDSSEVGFK